jgi:hypothetical protein
MPKILSLPLCESTIDPKDLLDGLDHCKATALEYKRLRDLINSRPIFAYNTAAYKNPIRTAPKQKVPARRNN